METQIMNLVLVPAIAGFLCLILPRIKFLKELIAGVAALWVLSISWAIFSAGEFYFKVVEYSISGMPVSLDLHGTALSGMIVLFIGLFGVLGAIYSWKYRAGEKGNNIYYALLLWTLAASDLAVLSDNLLFFIIFWELSTLFLYGLVNCGHRNRKAAAYGGYRTFAILGFSEAALLLAVTIIWRQFGTISISALSIPASGTMNVLLFLMFLVASLAKGGAMPFHAWVPASADGAPTSIMGFLPASLDKLLGIYFLVKICVDIFTLGSGLKMAVMIIGALTIIIAVMMALVQHDLKKLLAYHAVSQVGYMVLAIGIGSKLAIVGALFHMLNNAIYKAGLFYGAGAIEKQTGTTDLEKLGGLARYMPLTFFSMIIAALAISGVPPLNGFASKWMIYQACVDANQPVMLILAMVGSALTLASFIKVIYSVFFGRKPDSLGEIKPASASLWIPQIVLAMLCIVFGIFAAWPIKTFLAPAVGMELPALAGGVLGWAGSLWNSGLATGMIVLGVLLGIIIYVIGKAFKPRVAPTYYGGENLPVEDTRIPGTGFYETIEKLPVLKPLYKDSEKGVWAPDYFFASIMDGIFVKGLKRMHTGILSTYLSWSIIGLVALIFVLIIGG
jgi:formate hydrogenlyase subunit 3/multisubunit Na+/H+ antiporter MnhD subunit